MSCSMSCTMCFGIECHQFILKAGSILNQHIQRPSSAVTKVDVPDSSTQIIWTHKFEWYEVRCGSKNKY